MKNIQITLQPLSLIVGALLVGLVTLSISAISPAGGPTGRDAQLMVIDGQSSARNRVLIRAGAANAYTVPVGKILIIDGLGGLQDGGYTAILYVDNIATAKNYYYASTNCPPTSPVVIPEIKVNEGSTISITIWGDQGIATGYLVDA